MSSQPGRRVGGIGPAAAGVRRILQGAVSPGGSPHTSKSPDTSLAQIDRMLQGAGGQGRPVRRNPGRSRVDQRIGLARVTEAAGGWRLIRSRAAGEPRFVGPGEGTAWSQARSLLTFGIRTFQPRGTAAFQVPPVARAGDEAQARTGSAISPATPIPTRAVAADRGGGPAASTDGVVRDG